MTLEDLDNRMDEYGSGYSFIYDQLSSEEAYSEPPLHGVVHIGKHQTTPRYRRERRVLCIGCYDCRWWDNRNCTKPDEQFDPSICEWLSERAREKGE